MQAHDDGADSDSACTGSQPARADDSAAHGERSKAESSPAAHESARVGDSPGVGETARVEESEAAAAWMPERADVLVTDLVDARQAALLCSNGMAYFGCLML